MKSRQVLRIIACTAAFGAIVACSPREDASVHLTAMDEPNGEPTELAESSPSAETDDAVLARLANYADWRLVNPVRFHQRERLAELCAFRPEDWQRCNEQKSLALSPMIDLGDVEEDVFTSRAGIHVFVNPPAEAPMLTQKQPHFPEGSIIVKQKWRDAEQEVPDLLTVMIKREAGYNPDVGDWEFLAVAGDASRIEGRGRLDNCQECHIPRAHTDFIIRSYLPREILVALE